MEWGWGRLRSVILVNHLCLRETTSVSDEIYGCNQNHHLKVCSLVLYLQETGYSLYAV